MSHQQDVLKPDVTQCHECSLKVTIPQLKHGQKATCPRCGFQLTSVHEGADERVTVYAITSLIFLLLSLPFDFISFSAAGQTQTISIPSGLLLSGLLSPETRRTSDRTSSELT